MPSALSRAGGTASVLVAVAAVVQRLRKSSILVGTPLKQSPGVTGVPESAGGVTGVPPRWSVSPAHPSRQPVPRAHPCPRSAIGMIGPASLTLSPSSSEPQAPRILEQAQREHDFCAVFHGTSLLSALRSSHGGSAVRWCTWCRPCTRCTRWRRPRCRRFSRRSSRTTRRWRR